MTHGSLFSGIGGFDLAAEWMGWDNLFHCEWNPFCQKVLAYHFPNSIPHHDITKTDFTIYRGRVDILTGGFPCQPYSVAGEQKGTADERHLWPEMLRAICEIQPTFIVGENVSGLVSWNGGMVFEQVQINLEAQGYEVTPFLLPASGVNAPHQRERIWFIAYASCYGGSQASERGCGANQEDKKQSECLYNNGIIKNSNTNGRRGEQWKKESGEWEQRNISTGDNERICANNGEVGYFTNTPSLGWGRRRGSEEIRQKREDYIWERFSNTKRSCNEPNWKNFPTKPPVCDGDDGLSDRLDAITFPKWRGESIKALGNAIVPQVAHQIFKAIELYKKNNYDNQNQRN